MAERNEGDMAERNEGAMTGSVAMEMLDMTDPASAEVLRRTQAWVDVWVIGLNLCPFAAQPRRSGRIRWRVSEATTVDRLLDDLRDELALLAGTDAATLETTVLIHPQALTDFDHYNQCLDAVDGTLVAMDLDGVMQVASFHPDYRFGDASDDDPANATNRSPSPMLHLLREASISRVLEEGADGEAIIARNLRVMRALSTEQTNRLHRRVDGAESSAGEVDATPDEHP